MRSFIRDTIVFLFKVVLLFVTVLVAVVVYQGFSAAMSQQSKKIEELTLTLATATQEMSALRSSHETLTADLWDSRIAVRRSQDRVEELEKALEEARAENETLRQRVASALVPEPSLSSAAWSRIGEPISRHYGDLKSRLENAFQR